MMNMWPLKIVCSATVCLLLMAGIVCGQESSNDRFKWSFEEDGGGESDVEILGGEQDPSWRGVADEYEKLIKENLALRKQNIELERRSQRTEAENEELATQVDTLAERTQQPSETGSSARLNAELGAARGENAVLKNKIDNLVAELDSKGTAPEVRSSVPALAENSDLYKRLEKENTALREHMKEIKEDAARQGRGKEDEVRMAENRISELEDVEEQVSGLEEENSMLKAILEGLQESADEAVRLEQKYNRSQDELDAQEDMLAAQEQELKDLRKQVKQEQKEQEEAEAEIFEAERRDMYFNMAVLYTKTGLYRQAEKEFLRLLKVNAPAADVHYNLGILYDIYMGKKRAARKHYRKFVELAPDSADAGRVRLWLVEMDIEL